MKILVVGGGIGGLTTALALRHHGIEAIVLERYGRLDEVGAGIQIAANGTLVMRAFGLEGQLAAVGTVPQRYDYRDLATGRLLYLAPLGQEAAARYGAVMYNVHRADLIEILHRALPPETVRLGAEVSAIAQNERGVSVTLRTGEVIEADAIVGADGIHSVVREALHGPQKKQFANILMWRGLIPAERIKNLELPVAGNYWFGVHRNLITYWVRKDLYSVLAAVPALEVQRESWTESGDVGEMLASFKGAEPRAQRLLEAMDSAFITGMYYHDPIDEWSRGRITLLGDAAHAMVPYLAQGACQSMEDAWTLAVCLQRSGTKDVPGALVEYQKRRQPRATRMQAGARFVVKMAHEPDEEAVRARNGRWRGTARIDPLAETTWGFAWGHDILAAVNEPIGAVLGISASREGKRMNRPESQRAFDMWKGVFDSNDLARGAAGMRAAYDRFLQREFPPPSDLAITATELDGISAFAVTHPSAPTAMKGKRTILHFHGGGYVIGSAKSSLEYAGRLAAASEGTCFTVDYRLAPEHPYPAAIDDAFNAYRGLLASGVDPKTLFLSGESAGAGLAIALASGLARAGLALPAGIIGICAFSDLTLSGPSVMRYSGDDPASHRDSLTGLAAWYFQGHEPTDPLVSPLFGDLAGLPPLFLSAVRGEVLESDTTRLAEKAHAAGVDVTLEMVDDSVHVFTLFPFLPETSAILEKTRTWMRGLTSCS